jgi:hypothetical protein
MIFYLVFALLYGLLAILNILGGYCFRLEDHLNQVLMVMPELITRRKTTEDLF